MPQAIGLLLGNAALAATTGASLAASAAAFEIATAVGVGIGTIGLALGPSLLLGALGKGNVKPSDGQQAITQAVPARTKSYGRVRYGGIIWWFEPLNDIMSIGLALNQGRIDAIETIQIDGNTIALDGSGNVTTAPYNGKTTQIFTRLGLPVETAYPTILSDFGVANARGDGVATLLGRFQNFGADKQLSVYPNGKPTVVPTFRASLVWDPRAA